MRFLFALALLAGCAAPSEPPPAPELPSTPEAPPVSDMVPDAPPGGLTPAPDFEDEADYQAQRAEAVRALTEAVGDGAASAESSCRVFPYGNRPCGGPSDFVAVSTETAEVPDVLRLARAVTELDQAANAQFEYVSTCELLEPPPVRFRAGRCMIDE